MDCRVFWVNFGSTVKQRKYNQESRYYVSVVRVPASWKHTKEISVLLLISTLLSAFIYHILDLPTILNDAGVDAIELSSLSIEKEPNLNEVSEKYIY